MEEQKVRDDSLVFIHLVYWLKRYPHLAAFQECVSRILKIFLSIPDYFVLKFKVPTFLASLDDLNILFSHLS